MRRFFLFFAMPSLLVATDYFSFATGVYDIMRERHRTWEFEVEYKFLVKWLRSPFEWLEFRPLIGAMATVRGSVYAYGGINFDLLCGNHLVISPGFAAGYYAKGQGKNLGYPLEFRSGVEVGWQFRSGRRLGAHFYHLSNASLGKRNPGEESLVFYYDMPLVKGFPFNDD